MKPPPYFERIRRRAADRWRQLEDDDELAAPWRQLFSQVQSTQHVLSELLQNADDTGANWASASLEDGVFAFEHDGEDFSEEQFESLCRFGFSNKRNLHTIGFRGIGFKSTFSLGNMVEISTPTLSVCFRKQRFTEPEWIPRSESGSSTRIEIRVSDPNCARELQRNFSDWTKSPSSLLFFTHLRELHLQGKRIVKQSHGHGPIPNSWRVSLSDAWLALRDDAPSKQLLILQSDPEELPTDVLKEIRSERNVEELQFPPCRVEIVLGLTGTQRLFVVLPTGASIPLPFSCNAPFIQDPARYAIKDPATSPTNRWLLQRAGALVGKSLFAWLGDATFDLKGRAAAYDLFPSGIPADSTALEKSCAEAILEGFESAIEGKSLLLTAEGTLADIDECVAVPARLHEVWHTEQLTEIFGPEQAHVLAAEVSDRCVQILHEREWINRLDIDAVINRLASAPPPPKPASWANLHVLWSFVQRNVPHDWAYEKRRRLGIVPLEGKAELYPAKDVIRLSSRRDLISEADWNFLTDHALAVSAEWLAWLTQDDAKRGDGMIGKVAADLLQGLALHEPSPVDRIAARASERIFSGEEVLVEDCIRSAHIFAALGAKTPDGFKVVTRDLILRDLKQEIVADDTGVVEELTPDAWTEAHFLDSDYTAAFTSCKPQQWKTWIKTEGSGLNTFVPISLQQMNLWHRTDVERLVAQRGANKPKEYFYKKDSFTLRDHAFASDLTTHWQRLAERDITIWCRIMEGILQAPVHQWNARVKAEVTQEGTSYSRPLDCGFIPAAWVASFREVPCLYDIHGHPRAPAELLLRTPDTEPLMNIELFVRADLDTPSTKPLLKLLGVRDTPADSTKILGRLRAQAKLKDPNRFLVDIVRLYEALDRVVSRCAPSALKALQEALITEALILTESLEWVTSGEVAIFADAELGTPGVHPAVQRLSMWPRLGVSEQPALGKTLIWLQSLKTGAKLDPSAQKRVRLALQREPLQIWQSCGHWLSLDSTWETVDRLRFRLTMQQLTKWGELSSATRGAVADLRMLTAETALLPPFNTLRNLADTVQFQVTRYVEAASAGETPAWLSELAARLCRVQAGTDEESQRIREIAGRLYHSQWKLFNRLEVVPYVEGVPAGEPSSPRAFWQDRKLYVAAQRSAARIHKELADELSRPFAHPEIASAIAACIDREPTFVRDYLDGQFKFDFTLSLPGFEPPATPAKSGEPLPAIAPALATDMNGSAADLADSHVDVDVTGEPSPEADPNTHEQPEGARIVQNPPASKPRTAPDPSLIDRYATRNGFRWNHGTQVYLHPTTGHRIVADEAPFQWTEQTKGGEMVLRLWLSDQKLSRGVEVAAELWLALKQWPGTTAIVVLGDDQGLCVLTGTECLDMQKAEMLELFPSRFRLVAAA